MLEQCHLKESCLNKCSELLQDSQLVYTFFTVLLTEQHCTDQLCRSHRTLISVWCYSSFNGKNKVKLSSWKIKDAAVSDIAVHINILFEFQGSFTGT